MARMNATQIASVNNAREIFRQVGLGTRIDVLETASTASPLLPTTAGTVEASKLLQTGTAKDLDTLVVGLHATTVETGLTAHSGGTQAAALALSTTKSMHNITTAAAGNDSVKLPAATGSGIIHWVKNSAAANSIQLFGSGTDTIDGVATATGVAVAAGKSRICIDIAAGLWVSILGA